LVDVVELTRALIRRPSVTPADAGALDLLQGELERLGFSCRRLPFGEVDNLYARIGEGRPNFCFAGHVDVVPVGDPRGWTVDPFGAELVDGVVYGRGAADMKGAIAAFAAAAEGFLGARGRSFGGAISLLITGDEEGPAVNGTVKALERLAGDGEAIDFCVVGEPTNPRKLGEMVKHGRRGSLTGRLAVHGVQGHVAYPHLADNPIPRLIRTLSALTQAKLDDGDADFQPSNLEVVTIDVGNPATNVIPARAEATFNIRFSPKHSGASLTEWLRQVCAATAGRHELAVAVSGEPFLTRPGPLTELLVRAIREETGLTPELSTTGGTSDARFIARVCPVAEFGLVGQTMHKADERAAVADLEALARIYRRLLDLQFP
jgi:succinyl-diaminopimelate desuccinylase